MKEQFWKYMQQIQFKIFYLDLYADDAYKKDRAIKGFSAVASSGSIAAWAIWQRWIFGWAVIIAASQVINAVKGYLPYSARLKNIEQAQKPLKLLYNKIEYSWLSVQSGELTEKQINELLYEFQREYIEIESQVSNGDIFLGSKKMRERAKEQTELYFNNYLTSASSITDIVH